MPCLQIGGLRTHEMGELESDRLVVLLPGGRFELHAQLVELDREELDRHIPVKRFGIRPALDTVLIRHLLIDTEKGIQFIVIDMTVLESAGIHVSLDPVEYFRPFLFMLFHRDRFGFCQVSSSSSDSFLSVNPETSLHCLPKLLNAAIAPLVARLISWQRYHPWKLL